MLLWDAVRKPLRQCETLLRNRNMFNLRQIAEFDPLSSPEDAEVVPLHDDGSRYRSAPDVAKGHAADAKGMLPCALLPQSRHLAFWLESWIHLPAFAGMTAPLVELGRCRGMYAQTHAADAKNVAARMPAVADFVGVGLDCLRARALENGSFILYLE